MLRTTNIAEPQVAIIDFGMAQASVGKGLAGGTPGYRPPETNETNVWYPKGDIFSLGVTFFQLLANKVPDPDSGQMGIFQEGARCVEDCARFVASRPVPMHLIQKYRGTHSWLPQMMEKDRKKRPVSIQLLALPWFEEDEEQKSLQEDDFVDAEDPEDTAEVAMWAQPRKSASANGTANANGVKGDAEALLPPATANVGPPASANLGKSSPAMPTLPQAESPSPCQPKAAVVANREDARTDPLVKAAMKALRERVEMRYRNARAAFIAFDKKLKKAIDRQSFGNALAMLGMLPTPETLDQMFVLFDRSGSGEFSCSDFIAVVQSRHIFSD